MEHSRSASALIESAFAQARRSGKPEWWVMAIPVLKNRLLQITGQTFKESDFGVATFREFLQNNTDLIEIDNSFLPGAVTLKKSAQRESQAHDKGYTQGNRIREDLWRAILDYSSGNRYVWDANASVAVVAPKDSNGPFLPTITADTMTAWKQEFLTKLPEKPEDRRLVAWQTQSLPATALPTPLRLQWNRFVKDKVQSFVKEWFESQNLPLPVLVPTAVTSQKQDETELFRQFMIKCIAQMSKEELERLSIPSSVAFRINGYR